MKKHKIAIVGSGPAGLAAGIYTSRAEIETKIYAGLEPGGQLTKTTEIENYPGVIGKTGPELMAEMTKQAQKFGAEIIYEEVSDLATLRESYDAVILAMGASPRLLGVGEENYWGKGFSTCAVCDAAFYRGKNVYVVGGGDSAIEDALALTKFASKVTMLVRSDKLRASVAMQRRLEQSEVEVKWNTQVVGVEGERVETLLVTQGDSDLPAQVGTVTRLPAEGLFFAIGHIPATKWLENEGILDENGYVVVNHEGWPTMTRIQGVFAAGDCVDHRYRQAATAVGMGVSAALDIERWMNENTK